MIKIPIKISQALAKGSTMLPTAIDFESANIQGVFTSHKQPYSTHTPVDNGWLKQNTYSF